MTAPALTQYQPGVGAVTADNFNTFQQTCNTNVDLRGLVGTTGMQISTRGNTTIGDGGAGVFYWVSGSAYIDNNATVVVPFGFSIGAWLRVGYYAGASGIATVLNNAALTTLPSTAFPSVLRLGYVSAGDSPALVYTSVSTPPTINNGLGDGGSQVLAADGGTWLARFGGLCWASQFGVVAGTSAGSATTANTTQINAWISAATLNGIKAWIAQGTYNFNSTIQLPLSATGFSLEGAGSGSTIFTYTGASVTIDLIAGGNPVANTNEWSIRGFRVNSNTVMTSGAGLHLTRLGHSNLNDVFCGVSDFDATENMWNGFFFDGVHEVFMAQFGCYTRNDGLIVAANTNAGPNANTNNADLYLSQGYANFCGNAGIHVGGGFGGLFMDQIERLGNTNYGILIDNAIYSSPNQGNREVIDGVNCVSDGAQTLTKYGVFVNDTVSSGANLVLNGFYGSSVLDNIYVASWINGIIILNGSRIFNACRNGVTINDTTTHVQIGSGVVISTNGGYGSTQCVLNNLLTVTNNSGSILFVGANTLAVGQAVVFGFTSQPANIVAGTTYYVIAAGLTLSTFAVSTSLGGSAVAYGSAGSGVGVVYGYGITASVATANMFFAGAAFNNVSGDFQVNSGVGPQSYAVTPTGGAGFAGTAVWVLERNNQHNVSATLTVSVTGTFTGSVALVVPFPALYTPVVPGQLTGYNPNSPSMTAVFATFAANSTSVGITTATNTSPATAIGVFTVTGFIQI